jgi:hypothetical protein
MPPRKKTRYEFMRSWIENNPEIEVRDSLLFCTKCNVSFAETKSSVTRHVASNKHTGMKYDFNSELLKFVVGCNIPWTQVNNPIFKDFIENCVTGKFGKTAKVPSECQLRREYLNKVYDEKMNKIRSELKNEYIYVSVDETTDDFGRQIANVIVGALRDDHIGTQHLISSKRLDSTNNVSISNTVTSALDELWGANHNNHNKVLLLLTDGVGYMLKAGRNLKCIFPNLLHVTCLAHGLNRVAELVRKLYPDVNDLIANVKKTFLKSPKRIQKFKEMLPGVPLPPRPTIIRWGTWIEAATYYSKHYDEVKRVLNTFSPTEAQSIRKAKRAFGNANIKSDLNFIANHLMTIPNAIKKLQDAKLSISDSLKIVHETYRDVSKLNLSVKGKQIYDKLKLVLNKNSGYSTLKIINELVQGKEIELQSQTSRASIDSYKKFKYAPITTVDVERSFSSLKWIFTARRRRLTVPNIEKILIVYSENRVNY